MASPYDQFLPPRDVSAAATEEALQQGGAEQPEVAYTPVDAATFKRTPTPLEPVNLDNPDLSQNFIDDLRGAMLLSSKKDINPHSLGRTPRQVLMNAMAQGAISPSYEPEEDMGALRGYWESFKTEMEPSMLGAVARGAKEAVGSTLGGLAGTLVGSAIPIPGATIAGSFGGAELGGKIQETLFPPTPEDVAQAMMDFELPQTRYGRMLGNYIPGLLTWTQKFSDPRKLNRPEILQAAIGATLPTAYGLAKKAAVEASEGKTAGQIVEDIDPRMLVEQLAFDAASALVTKPNRVGRWIADKQFREYKTAERLRNQTMINAAGGEGPALKAAEEIAFNQPNLNVGDVAIGSGELSRNVGLIGLQGALENREGMLRQQKLSSLRAVGTQLGSQLKAANPKSPEYLRYQFEGQNQEAKQKLEAVRDQMIAEGQADAAVKLSKALDVINENELKAREQVITMEQAHARTTQVLQAATHELMQANGMTTKEQAGTNVSQRFAANKEVVNADVTKLFEDASAAGGATDFKNTYKAASRVMEGRDVSAKQAGLDVIPKVKAIIDTFAPDVDGNRQSYPIAELQKLLSSITEEIRDLPEGQRKQESALNAVKDALLADLDAVQEVSPKIREARAAYRDYAERFLNKSSEGALKKEAALFIDNFVSKAGVQEMRRLRSALVDPGTNTLPDAVATDLATFQLNKLADKNIVTSKQLTKWMQSNDGTAFTNTFPETVPTLKRVIDGIINASKEVDAALDLKNQSEKNLAAELQLAKRDASIAEQKSKIETRESSTKAREQYQEKLDALKKESASAFLGRDPLDAINRILTSTDVDPVQAMQGLAQRALQDPSGGATLALQDTVKLWLNREIRNAGKAMVESLDPSKKLSVQDLRVSEAKLNALLTDAKIMSAASTVLSPKELQALNLASKQMIALTQRLASNTGASDTNLMQANQMIIEQGLSGNVMGVMRTLLRAADPTYKKQASTITGNAVELVARLFRGNPKEAYLQMMTDAMSNPDVAMEALRDVRSNPERTKAFVKHWLFWQKENRPYQPLPFSVQNASREDFADGSVVIDTLYGYKIYQMPGKKFRLVNPSGTVSIHDTFNDAQNKALREHVR
jgi:hypothetical protein